MIDWCYEVQWWDVFDDLRRHEFDTEEEAEACANRLRASGLYSDKRDIVILEVSRREVGRV